MKKVISLLLALVLMASFTACASNSKNQTTTKSTTKSTTTSTTTTTTEASTTTTTEKKEPESKYPTETELLNSIKKEYDKLSKGTFTVIFKDYKSKSPVYTLNMIMNGKEMELGEIQMSSPVDSGSVDYGRITGVNCTSTLPIGDLNSYAAYNYQIAAIPAYTMAKFMRDTYLDFNGFYKQFTIYADTSGSYIYEIPNYDIMGILSKSALTSNVVYGEPECQMIKDLAAVYKSN